ncbi:tripartite tricarboxylate transporter TctB family protein [bacterium LRH843]|nr:tripartite tricarboxylate transporter TctB family protein [bacterium LRH843]
MKKTLNQDVYIGIFLLVLAAILFGLSLSIKGEAIVFPIGLVLLLALFAILIMISGFKNREASSVTEEDNGEEENLSLDLLRNPFGVLLITFFYILLMNFIGFFPSTALFFICYFLYMGIKGISKYVFIISSFMIIVYVLFTTQLKVFLPAGTLFN